MQSRFDARWCLIRAARPLMTRLPEWARVEGLACRLVTPRLLAAGRGNEARGKVNGSEYALSLSDYLEAKAWITGRQAPDVVAFCRANLPPGGVACDVGANVGFITVPLGKQALSSGGRVIAIEALPRNVKRLRQHVAWAGVENSVEIVACAVGNAPGDVEITVEPGDGFTSNGLVRRIGEDRFPGRSDSVRVAADTLDAICEARGIETIHVIKLDVEGFEPLVLQGAQRLLSRGAIRAGILEINESLLALRGWRRDTVLQLLLDNGLRPEPLRVGGDLRTDWDIAFRAVSEPHSRPLLHRHR